MTRAVDIVANVIESNTIPILQNCRLQADGQKLLITATDLDLEITVQLPAAADSRFDVTIPAKSLSNFLKKATKSNYVTLAHDIDATDPKDKGRVKLDFEKVNYTVDALPSSDFPSLSTVEFSHVFSIAGQTLVDAITSVKGAISQEETRYYLNGIFMHDYEGQFVMVATDGHRLYRRVLDYARGRASNAGGDSAKKDNRHSAQAFKGQKNA
ncbi:MAG: hypothetical protein U5K75_03010 [Ahrensia sp.]|nr:hypothetical protein [Ahrensia sp.]